MHVEINQAVFLEEGHSTDLLDHFVGLELEALHATSVIFIDIFGESLGPRLVVVNVVAIAIGIISANVIDTVRQVRCDVGHQELHRKVGQEVVVAACIRFMGT